MSSLPSIYRRVHEQGFLPIFTDSDTPSEVLVEVCVEAGCQVIEYTLRRRDAHRMIPWIREHYPEIGLIVGSTLDNEDLVRHGRAEHPQLMTIDELAAIGVDGFVSMVGFHLETIRRYCSTHLMIAPVSTMLEMFSAVSAGAHFAKIAGSPLELVSTLRNPATFGFSPIMVTGGMTLERIPLAVQRGAVVVGAGFDLILGGLDQNASVSQMAKALARYLRVTQESKHEKWPALADARAKDFCSWTATLPHFHPFAEHHC